MSIRNYANGVIFCFILVFTAYFGMLFIVPPLWPLILFRPELFRRLMDGLIALWITNTVGLLELLFGIKMVITGDLMKSNERSLILMNHRTRLDWMFFWSCIWRQSSLSSEKIILKSPLKKIPGAGWAMQAACYIFLDRKWESDQHCVQLLLDYFRDTKTKTQILLFPEGTDFNKISKTMSDQFAAKNNLEPYEYVLHPRTTGFTYMAQYMRQEEILDAVYDVTLGYPVNLPQDEIAILKGDFPKEIHFNVKRHQIHTLPITEEHLREWCNKRWNEKEEKLKIFYNETKRFNAHPLKFKDRSWVLRLAVSFWTCFIFVCFVLCWFSSVVFWYVLVCSALYSIAFTLSGGLEFLQILIYNKYWNQRHKNV